MQRLKSYPIILAAAVILLIFGINIAAGAVKNIRSGQNEVAGLQANANEMSKKIDALENQLNQILQENRKLADKIDQASSSSDKASIVVKNTTNQVAKAGVLTTQKTKVISKNKLEQYSFLDIGGMARYRVAWGRGENAFTQLVKAAAANNFSIKYKTYSFGVFVECIGGVCGDANHFWALSKNGQPSNVGASLLFVNPDDEISWTYASF